MNRPLNGGSPSPHSADSNAPTSSQSLISSALQSSRQSLLHDGQITPSISLIPIKQVCTFEKLFIFILSKELLDYLLKSEWKIFDHVQHRSQVVMITKICQNRRATVVINSL